MKKQILLLIGLITSASVFAQVETYTTDYKILYEADYLRYLDAENRRFETLYLFAGAEGSVFMNNNKANAEEIKQKMKNISTSGTIDLDKTGYQTTVFNNLIYKDYKNNEVWGAQDVARKDYTYKEEAAPLVWEISNETKIYEQYEVQKATTSFAGRDYIAWFTMEIPIADGPYVFSGLPGLIVELYDTDEHYIFSLLSVEKLSESKSFELNMRNKVSKNKLNEIKEKVKQNSTTLSGLINSPNAVVITSTTTTTELPKDAVVGKVSIEMNGKEVSEAELNKMLREQAQRKENTLELE